ncbi:MAG: putative Na+/H+ antiporter [Pseudomonadota bacterium]
MSPTNIEIAATGLFAVAVIHTFLTSRFRHFAGHFPEGSFGENLLHLLGEVEIVFGFWAGVLVAAIALFQGRSGAIQYVEGLRFTEPLFVLAVMTVAATRPVLHLARKVVFGVAKMLPVGREASVYFSCLAVGPLLGSLITEPAAMTVTALLMKDRFFGREVSDRFKYITLAVLFVNVSIGGVLTPYAAPPVLMVATQWNWGLGFMLATFGWKAALATLLNALLAATFLRSELKDLSRQVHDETERSVPVALVLVHLFFLTAIVVTAHHPAIFLGLFLFFLGIVSITQEFQDALKIRESLLVAFFLSGLVVLGALQSWWLEPLIRRLDTLPLFLGTAALTAVTDNAALTYLGSQVENVSEVFKYALVAGAVAGGGLTVIANAPNPAGYSVLQDKFGPDGIRPGRLFVAALIPTFIAMSILWFG